MSLPPHSLVVVTGAAGFIGSHLVDASLAAGFRVLGIDSFITSSPENLAHLEHNPDFTFIEADASHDPHTYLPSGTQPALVLHFASPASPPLYQAHPVETYLVNSLGTHFWLQYLKANSPAGRFLFASTSEVYGDPDVHPQPETYWGNVNPNGMRSCYDESKRLGETICGVHQRDFGLDVRIVRIFNTYGPRMNLQDGRIIPGFGTQLLKGEPLTVYGSGDQTRSYCYIDDLVAGIMALAMGDGLSGETVNLGNTEELTVMQTAQAVFAVGQKLGLTQQTTCNIEHKPLPADDPTRRKPDTTKAQTLLNWIPKISLEQGLEATLRDFAARLPA